MRADRHTRTPDQAAYFERCAGVDGDDDRPENLGPDDWAPSPPGVTGEAAQEVADAFDRALAGVGRIGRAR